MSALGRKQPSTGCLEQQGTSLDRWFVAMPCWFHCNLHVVAILHITPLLPVYIAPLHNDGRGDRETLRAIRTVVERAGNTVPQYAPVEFPRLGHTSESKNATVPEC